MNDGFRCRCDLKRTDMNIAGDLIALEEQFWKGDADFYRQRLTAEALMVFPDPVGGLAKRRPLRAFRKRHAGVTSSSPRSKPSCSRPMPHSWSIARRPDEPRMAPMRLEPAACTSVSMALGHSRSTSKRRPLADSVGSPNADSVTDRRVSAIVRAVHQSASMLRPSSAPSHSSPVSRHSVS